MHTHAPSFHRLSLMQVKALGLPCSGTQSACLEALMMLRGTPGACSRTAQQGAQELPAQSMLREMLACQHSPGKPRLHLQVRVTLKWPGKAVTGAHRTSSLHDMRKGSAAALIRSTCKTYLPRSLVDMARQHLVMIGRCMMQGMA